MSLQSLLTLLGRPPWALASLLPSSWQAFGVACLAPPLVCGDFQLGSCRVLTKVRVCLDELPCNSDRRFLNPGGPVCGYICFLFYALSLPWDADSA